MIRYFAVIRRQVRRHRRLVVAAAAVVVFATTYALVLPAITLDDETASDAPGIELAGTATDAAADAVDVPAEEDEQPTDDAGASEENAADGQSTEAAEPDSSEQPATDDATTPAGELTYRGGDYAVTVSWDESAGIPSDAELQVSEVDQGSDEYASYVEQAASALGDGSEVAAARFFDVSLLVGGQEVEPATPVRIDISYDQALSAASDADVKQVHFADSGTEVLDVDATRDGDGNVTQVSLEQSSLSVTGTVVKALSSGWPDEEGYYVMVVKSGDKYYAVRSVTTGSYGNESYAAAGSLTEVNYDETTNKVTFPDMDDSSDLVNYEWEYTTGTSNSSGPGGRTTISHYLSNGSTYISPNYSSATSTTQRALSQDSSGHLYYGSSYGYDYYLTADTARLTLGSTTSQSSAVQVFFANQFDATATQGGTSGDPETPEVDLGAPATSKSLTPNNDGTYQLSLTVTGKSQAQQSRSKADVIIVFDRSGSMQTADAGNNQRRDTVAISATKALATALLANNTTDYPDTVEIGIVQFNNTASTALNLTNNATSISSAINGLTAQGNTGTNWESALKAASNFSTREGAAKYVIFVSDGNPTFHVSDEGWDDWNSTYQVYGGGSDTNATTVRHCYEAAKDDARALVQSGAEFYTVGVFGSVNRMSALTAYAYSGNDVGTYPAGHYQTASDTASLTAAFQSIINEINHSFAFTDVTLTDGITGLTSTAAIADGAVGAFTYSGTNADGDAIAEADIPDWVKTARYDSTTKSVVWDLGDNRLPDGVTYKVEFTVWPTQQAYDVIAALQNGTISWQEDATVNDQTVDWTKFERSGEEGSYTYSYKTNTSQTVTYKQVTTGSDDSTTTSAEKTSEIPADPLPAMRLDKTQVSVSKEFSGGTASMDGLTLTLWQDGESFVSPLELNRGTGDNADTFSGSAYVAPGLIRTESNGSYEVLETGHDYTLTESGEKAGKWTLTTETCRPMVIETQLVMLKREGTTQPASGTYYKIGDYYYTVIEGADATISATNSLKTFSIQFLKDDGGGKAATKLAGAKFELVRVENGTGQNVTGASGFDNGSSNTFTIDDAENGVTISRLPAGSYKLTEVKAPDGYVVSGSPITFTIDDSGQVNNLSPDGSAFVEGATITVHNTPGEALPNTGGTGTTPFALAGAALATTALLGLALRRRSGRGDA